VRRVNVSLDTLDPAKFREVTRWGELDKVLAGLQAADRAGLEVKINTVALKGFNDAEAVSLIEWAHGRGYDLTFIEVMPLGAIEKQRFDQYLPLTELRASLRNRFTLVPSLHATGGPARYFDVDETGGRVGFITPLTHNFCESCNRVRVTCTGTLYMCLGQDDAADLREPLRRSQSDAPLESAIRDGILRKPKGHDFLIERTGSRVSTSRHMSVTGG
jgi:cyclic pyranopterin phosphate synthase